jgi:hypothetical protein
LGRQSRLTTSENGQPSCVLINIYRTPVSGVLRRKDSGFAVCGENLASVSHFVAGIRRARSAAVSSDPKVSWMVCAFWPRAAPHQASMRWSLISQRFSSLPNSSRGSAFSFKLVDSESIARRWPRTPIANRGHPSRILRRRLWRTRRRHRKSRRARSLSESGRRTC